MQVTSQILSQTEVKKLTDQLIHDYCVSRGNEARKIDERYALLWDAVQTLLLAGGKRFRPYMLLLAYDAYSQTGDTESIYPAVVAQEIVHAAMLMHDDIIDRDTIRYGVNNIAGQYDASYASYISDHSERGHFALSTALLAGDMLLSDSHTLIHTIKKPAELKEKADEILSRGIFEVIGGELLDTEATILPTGSISPRQIARYKTASYSFISPLTMGATLANAAEGEIKLLTELGESLGIAYQLRDDILGVFGDSEQTGKSTSSDITEGKRTVLIEQFDDVASEEQSTRFYSLFHRDNLQEFELLEAKELLVESGALNRVEQEISHLQRKALESIKNLSLTEDARQSFSDLVTSTLSRNA